MIDGRDVPDQSLLARYSSRGAILRRKAWSELMILVLFTGERRGCEYSPHDAPDTVSIEVRYAHLRL